MKGSPPVDEQRLRFVLPYERINPRNDVIPKIGDLGVIQFHVEEALPVEYFMGDVHILLPNSGCIGVAHDIVQAESEFVTNDIDAHQDASPLFPVGHMISP